MPMSCRGLKYIEIPLRISSLRRPRRDVCISASGFGSRGAGEGETVEETEGLHLSPVSSVKLVSSFMVLGDFRCEGVRGSVGGMRVSVRVIKCEGVSVKV